MPKLTNEKTKRGRWSNIGGVFASPCYMCGAETEDRVAVGEDGGCAAICSLECELRFEGERQAANGIALMLDNLGLRDVADGIRKGSWKTP